MSKVVKVVLAMACIAVPGQAANAADVAPPAYKVASAPAPMANWTGFYAGVHAGWGQTSGDPGAASISTTGYAAPVFETRNLEFKGNGPLFGGQLGFNWQVNPSWVVGLEGDITGTGLKSSATGTPTCVPPFCVVAIPITGANQQIGRDINWLASLRGRLGYNWASSMLYVTGGAAWANVSYRADSADAVDVCNGGGGGGQGCSYPASLDGTKTGWTVGGGYEAMIAANWSFRIEYLFYRFGGTTVSAAGTPAGACAVPTCSAAYTFPDFDVHTARVGVNYRF